MKKKILSILQYLFFLGLGIFLVWWSIHKIGDEGWIQFKQALADAKYLLIIPVAVILLLSHYFRSLRWKLLMEPLGYKPTTTNTYLAVLIGYLANLAVPRLGEVLKCTILGKYEKVPADKLVGTIVVERAIDFVTLVLVFILTLILESHVVGGYAADMLGKLYQNKQGGISYTRIGGILAGLLILYVITRYILKNYAHINIVDKIKNILLGVWAGLTSVQHMKKKWLFVCYSLLIWTCYLLGTYIGFMALKETALVPFNAAFPVLTFASVGMIITPGGIGAYAVFVGAVLELYHVPEAIGLANGTLQWFAQFLIVLSTGFIALMLLPWYNKRISHAQR
ncbi:MAG: flippase-like domain-containing protein [Sphingobacteriales bacterium]|nr:flippase-like domain-containing protein [Sphingobacteriales bacterium]MBI3717378.1 flippase-like domain-containing protein [Sphingobacteriales bacterium]